MAQQIIVLNEKGEKVGITFERRARQLVDKSRAEWHNPEKTAIRLNHCPEPLNETDTTHKEETKMDWSEATNNGKKFEETYTTESRGYTVASEAHDKGLDESIYKIAQFKAQRKFRFLMVWATFFASQVIVFSVANTFWMISGLIGLLDAVAFSMLCLFTVHYFIEVTPDKVIKEYRRLERKIK